MIILVVFPILASDLLLFDNGFNILRKLHPYFSCYIIRILVDLWLEKGHWPAEAAEWAIHFQFYSYLKFQDSKAYWKSLYIPAWTSLKEIQIFDMFPQILQLIPLYTTIILFNLELQS